MKKGNKLEKAADRIRDRLRESGVEIKRSLAFEVAAVAIGAKDLHQAQQEIARSSNTTIKAAEAVLAGPDSELKRKIQALQFLTRFDEILQNKGFKEIQFRWDETPPYSMGDEDERFDSEFNEDFRGKLADALETFGFEVAVDISAASFRTEFINYLILNLQKEVDLTNFEAKPTPSARDEIRAADREHAQNRQTIKEKRYLVFLRVFISEFLANVPIEELRKLPGTWANDPKATVEHLVNGCALTPKEIFDHIVHTPVKCQQFEYDLGYHGGDYNEVGDFAYVPKILVDLFEDKSRAFEFFTGIDAVQLVHYSDDADESVDQNGEDWQDDDED